ncbi:transformation/transcription domain-associated protein isoform X1 [Tanacetum coccineum]
MDDENVGDLYYTRFELSESLGTLRKGTYVPKSRAVMVVLCDSYGVNMETISFFKCDIEDNGSMERITLFLNLLYAIYAIGKDVQAMKAVRLLELDANGAELSKIEAAEASIQRLTTKLNVSIKLFDAITKRDTQAKNATKHGSGADVNAMTGCGSSASYNPSCIQNTVNKEDLVRNPSSMSDDGQNSIRRNYVMGLVASAASAFDAAKDIMEALRSKHTNLASKLEREFQGISVLLPDEGY